MKLFSKKTKKGTIGLNDVLLKKRNVIIRFIDYLYELHNNATQYMTFFLENQIYQISFLKEPKKARVEAQTIYDKYFAENSIICCELMKEEQDALIDLKIEMKRPNRNTFTVVQFHTWLVLKENFATFKSLEGLKDKIDKKRLNSIKNKPSVLTVIDLYDKFRELYTQSDPNDATFRPPLIEKDYRSLNHTEPPDFDDIFKDKDLFLAFREYLYQRNAQHKLSFYFEVVCFGTLSDEIEIATTTTTTTTTRRSSAIFDKYIGPQAEKPVDLDVAIVERLKLDLERTPQADCLFKTAYLFIQEELVDKWFPDFINSPIFLACNDETIEYVQSGGGLKRSNTLDLYLSIINKRTKSLNDQ